MIFRRILIIIICAFAAIGILFTGVFFAMKLGWTNVAGSIDARNASFTNVEKEFAKVTSVNNGGNNSQTELSPLLECQIMTISSVLPENGQMILDTYTSTKSPVIAAKMIQAVALVTANNQFLQDRLSKCSSFSDSPVVTSSSQNVFDWEVSPEWVALHDALVKDQDSIKQAAAVSGVPARTIVASVIAEQFRFFTSNRESFKKYFEPLKILGNGTQFSYGVAGVKVETAQAIEGYLKDPTSPYYLGPSFENIFAYGPNDDPGTVQLARLTDNTNHYYSYLYTGIFLRQIEHQWQDAGYPINDRPEVLATLFNLGFNKSVPKAGPEVGGSTITVGDRDYTFGGLAFEFYYSGELSDVFPLTAN